MDFPHCTLVNASPVNNGPGTIYQTTSTLNGQPTDMFSSGMQYSSKNDFLSNKIFFLKTVLCPSAVLGPTIDTATGLQLQQATAYTTLPAQYPIYAPTIYSHLPTTTLIPSALASPGKEG
jgi:hypothetical protein